MIPPFSKDFPVFIQNGHNIKKLAKNLVNRNFRTKRNVRTSFTLGDSYVHIKTIIEHDSRERGSVLCFTSFDYLICGDFRL